MFNGATYPEQILCEYQFIHGSFHEAIRQKLRQVF